MTAAHQEAAKTALRALAIRRHRNDVLHLEMVEQKAVHRAIHALSKEVLEPSAIEPAHARMTSIFAREEHHRAVLGEQLHHVLGAIEVDVVPIGPMQTANGVEVLELPDTMLQGL